MWWNDRNSFWSTKVLWWNYLGWDGAVLHGSICSLQVTNEAQRFSTILYVLLRCSRFLHSISRFSTFLRGCLRPSKVLQGSLEIAEVRQGPPRRTQVRCAWVWWGSLQYRPSSLRFAQVRNASLKFAKVRQILWCSEFFSTVLRSSLKFCGSLRRTEVRKVRWVSVCFAKVRYSSPKFGGVRWGLLILAKSCWVSLRLAKGRQGGSLRIAEVRCGPLTFSDVRQGSLELATMHCDELGLTQVRRSFFKISRVLSRSPRMSMALWSSLRFSQAVS